jgi:hypothetical protein
MTSSIPFGMLPPVLLVPRPGLRSVVASDYRDDRDLVFQGLLNSRLVSAPTGKSIWPRFALESAVTAANVVYTHGFPIQ